MKLIRRLKETQKSATFGAHRGKTFRRTSKELQPRVLDRLGEIIVYEGHKNLYWSSLQHTECILKENVFPVSELFQNHRIPKCTSNCTKVCLTGTNRLFKSVVLYPKCHFY